MMLNLVLEPSCALLGVYQARLRMVHGGVAGATSLVPDSVNPKRNSRRILCEGAINLKLP